ncbi:MAG: glycosyltransferase [Phycisphaerales bacterium]|nr:glycosyltransferase [Phycisphaerae bacterium]NNM24461.1 glycosyltransferase [Phycisphaerales bacterium]
MTVRIVIPCYNEAERLPVDVFRGFAAEHPEVRFVFVNDGSTDATAEVLEQLRGVDPGVFEVVTLERNQGKAEAVRSGVLHAFRDDPEYVGYWDADLSTGLDQILVFRDALAQDSALSGALGSRVRLLGRHVERTVRRHYLGRIFATAAALLLGMAVYDTQCGAKLFRTTDEVRGLFSEPFLSKWIFDVEILARLIACRRRGGGAPASDALLEIPLPAWRDVGGSKIHTRHMVGAVGDLLRIWRRYRVG